MSYLRPTLSDLRQRARTYFTARIPGADLTLRRSVLAVIADLLAALVNGLYGFIDYLATLVLPDRCPDDYLLRWAAIFGVPRLAGRKATGNALLTGLSGRPVAAGTVLHAQAVPGQQFQTQYLTLAAATIGVGGSVAVAIEATAPGVDSNLPAGAVLTLATAVSGVDATAAVQSGGLTGGIDQEPLEIWRGRVLDRIQDPPQGGNSDDYVRWATSVDGVTRAWVYPENRGAGTVDITFVMDGRDSIIPLSGDLAAVQAAIDAVRPVTDDCMVFASTAQALNLTLSSLAPDTTATRAAVEAAWKDLVLSDAIPGGALSFQDQIVPAIAASAGVSGFTISSPSADVPGISGTLYTPGSVTFPT